MIIQAGDSDEGREFAAATADAIFSRYGTLEAGQAFYTDVKDRLAKYGRTSEQLVILPAATFVLGDTDADAHERAHVVRLQQVSGQTAIKFLEQLWNADLSGYDPDGPLPDIDPVLGEHTIARGRASVRMYRDPQATAKEWRQLAEAKNLSIRELIIEVTGRQTFIGSPRPSPPRSTAWSRRTPATASSSSRTSRRAGSTSSRTRSCRCCRNAVRSGPSTPARPCASTSAWTPEHDDGPGFAPGPSSSFPPDQPMCVLMSA